MTMTRKTWYKIGTLVQQPDFISKIWKIEKRKKAGLEARMKSRWCGSYRTNSIMSLWLMTSKRTTTLLWVLKFLWIRISLNIFRSTDVTTNYKKYFICVYIFFYCFSSKTILLVYCRFKKWRDKSKIKIGCWIWWTRYIQKICRSKKKIQYDSKIF